MTVALVTGGLIANAEIMLDFSANIDAEITNYDCSCPDSEKFIIKRGDSLNLDFKVMANGVRLAEAELNDAQEIIFTIKQDALDDNDDAIVYKDLTDGITVLPDMGNDSPNVRVVASSSDLTLDEDSYPIGLQIKFNDGTVKEATLYFNDNCFKTTIITQDVVR